VAALGVVAPLLQQLIAEGLLGGLREIPGLTAALRDRSGSLQQGREFLTQRQQPAGELRFADVGLKGLGQDFPGAALLPRGVLLHGGQLAGLLQPQLNQGLEGRRKTLKGVGLFGFLPEGIALGLRLGELADQGRVQAGLTLPLPAQELEIALLLRAG